jgi:hypothetical protein
MSTEEGRYLTANAMEPCCTWPDWLKHFLAVIRLNHQLVEQKNRIDGRTVHLQQL